MDRTGIRLGEESLIVRSEIIWYNTHISQWQTISYGPYKLGFSHNIVWDNNIGYLHSWTLLGVYYGQLIACREIIVHNLDILDLKCAGSLGRISNNFKQLNWPFVICNVYRIDWWQTLLTDKECWIVRLNNLIILNGDANYIEFWALDKSQPLIVSIKFILSNNNVVDIVGQALSVGDQFQVSWISQELVGLDDKIGNIERICNLE